MGWVHLEDSWKQMKPAATTAQDFLSMPGVVVGGHSTRHCLRVRLPDGTFGYLKKQHRVSWKERAASFLAGFGWVSSSAREAVLLRELADKGHPCPPVLAWGEHQGRAFLLLAEVRGMKELRAWLDHHPDPHHRRRLAMALGETLGTLHRAGFDHPDLSAKHLLIGEDGGNFRFCLLDWQRGRRGSNPQSNRKMRALAVLDVTVPDELADRSVRRAFLRSYLRTLGGTLPLRTRLAAIGRHRNRLQGRPRLREQRRRPSVFHEEGLIWLDGEALCVAANWLEERNGQPPHGLEVPPNVHTRPTGLERLDLPAPFGHRHVLTRRWVDPGFRFPRTERGFPAFEFATAGALTRLRRVGVPACRMLAVGMRDLARRKRFSFLLVELPASAVALRSWFLHQDAATRDRVYGLLLRLLHGIHEAGYRLRNPALFLERDVYVLPGEMALMVGGAEGLERSRRLPGELARDDVPALTAALPWSFGIHRGVTTRPPLPAQMETA